MQMDNVRIKLDIRCFEVLHTKKNIVVIDWSAYNPDLNPIENVWANIKGKFSGKRFISIK